MNSTDKALIERVMATADCIVERPIPFGPTRVVKPRGFAAMPKEQQRAARYAEKFETVIHFEDHGQDFLRWILRDGAVVQSLPFQSWLWSKVKLLSRPRVGSCLRYELHGETYQLRYPVTKIERRPIEQVQS